MRKRAFLHGPARTVLSAGILLCLYAAVGAALGAPWVRPLHAQEMTSLLAVSLEKGDRAVISGDYVRVRSGPTLEHRILTKVNTGTEVIVLARSETTQEIGGARNYWYQVRVEDRDVEGWIYGQFVKKRELTEDAAAEREAPQFSLPAAARDAGEPLELSEIAVIDRRAAAVAAGDLDGDGSEEILLLSASADARSHVLEGYQEDPRGFSKIYTVNMRGVRADGFDVLETNSLEFPILSVLGGSYTTLYAYDTEKQILRPIGKLPTPMVALGTLDGNRPYLVSLKRNKTADRDGTVTYLLEAVRVEATRGRLVMRERIEYEKPLPVKKLVLFDLDGDGRDEIVAEIGGGDSGGGITILRLESGSGSLSRVLNTGIPTYGDSPFVAMWGTELNAGPRLVVYSTNPEGSADAGTSFGLITAALTDGILKVESFHPVNRMLDEANNGRHVVPFEVSKSMHLPAEGRGGPGSDTLEGLESDGPASALPFFIVDTDAEANRTSVKRALM